MDAFILETLGSRGWRRGGEVFWSLDDAKSHGRTLIRHKAAKAVRVLPCSVVLDAAATIPEAGSVEVKA